MGKGMNRTGSIVVIAMLVMMVAASGSAQTSTPVETPPAAARPIDRSDLRHQIYVMEGALARAVSFGAQRLTRELRTVVPEMMALSGEPQARGVYLDGYGVFFDVGVPILHQSMMWSIRTMLGQDEKGLAEAVTFLKSWAAKERDATQRIAIENAIARLEVQLGPLRDAGAQPDITASNVSPNTATTLGTPTTRRSSDTVEASLLNPDAPVPAPSQPAPMSAVPMFDKKYLRDPNAINRAYTDSVQSALIDAMIDYSLPMALAPDEYLTVGARDNMQRDTLAPPDPYEEVVTLLLRIKGADLAAYRAGQIDRHEARKRVELREF